jgi:chromosome segregation ATPase
MSEKNPLNAYNQFEAIRAAVDQLETIHVYELNARQYGDADTPSLKNQVAELDKQILEYELQLAELQAYSEDLEKSNKILLEANNKLIAEKKFAEENRQATQDEADKVIEAYNKLPRIVKKLYGKVN